MNLQKKNVILLIKACSIRKCPTLSDNTSLLPCCRLVINFNDDCIRIYLSKDNALCMRNCVVLFLETNNTVWIQHSVCKQSICIHYQRVDNTGKLKNHFIIFLFFVWFLIKRVILSTLFVYIHFQATKEKEPINIVEYSKKHDINSFYFCCLNNISHFFFFF